MGAVGHPCYRAHASCLVNPCSSPAWLAGGVRGAAEEPRVGAFDPEAAQRRIGEQEIAVRVAPCVLPHDHSCSAEDSDDAPDLSCSCRACVDRPCGALAPREGSAQEAVAKSKIVSVGIFKNGLALVQQEVQVPDAGTYQLDTAPEPVHGTTCVC